MKNTRTKRPDNCVECDHPMRPYTWPEHRAPGTVKHGSNGRCEACCTRNRRGGLKRKPTGNKLTDAEMAWLRTAHPHAYKYHMDRRRRGIPAEGLKLKGDK